MRRGLPLLICLLLCFAVAQPAMAGTIRVLGENDPKPELNQPGTLEVHLINVASADCILLRGGGQTLMVDSGILRNYERITAYLEELGIDRLDAAFGSHPHDDHIGGFVGVLDEVPVGVYLQPRLFEEFKSDIQTKLNAVIARNNIPTMFVENDSSLQLGDAHLWFFQWQNPSATQNNRSMLIRAELGDCSILLTADASGDAQIALSEEWGSAMQADILKFPHHGLTDYKSVFHEAVQPQLATISNVKDKITDVLGQIENQGVEWMLTTKGTIVFVTDGTEWVMWQIPRVVE